METINEKLKFLKRLKLKNKKLYRLKMNNKTYRNQNFKKYQLIRIKIRKIRNKKKNTNLLEPKTYFSLPNLKNTNLQKLKNTNLFYMNQNLKNTIRTKTIFKSNIRLKSIMV